jgi:hypothetical protein
MPHGLWKTYGRLCVFPTLQSQSSSDPNAHRGPGRPPLRDTHAREIAYLATELAFSGRSIRGMAREQLRDFPGAGTESVRSALKERAKRAFELLHDDGCLPWAAFPRGTRPPHEWWLDERFVSAAILWQRCAETHGAIALVMRQEQVRIKGIAAVIAANQALMCPRPAAPILEIHSKHALLAIAATRSSPWLTQALREAERQAQEDARPPHSWRSPGRRWAA